MNRNCRSDLSKTECDVEVVQKLAGEFRVNVENGSQVIETDFVQIAVGDGRHSVA